jgi:hypothetical protein
MKYSNSTMAFVELLWTLKDHSLGQLEDQVKVISYLYFILFVDILGNLPSMVHSFVNTLGSNGALKVGKTSSI